MEGKLPVSPFCPCAKHDDTLPVQGVSYLGGAEAGGVKPPGALIISSEL